MQFHLAPRVLKRDGHHSIPLAATSSILADMKESGLLGGFAGRGAQ